MLLNDGLLGLDGGAQLIELVLELLDDQRQGPDGGLTNRPGGLGGGTVFPSLRWRGGPDLTSVGRSSVAVGGSASTSRIREALPALSGVRWLAVMA